MWQEAEGTIWRWVTDAKGERVRLAVTCSRQEVIAAARAPRSGWLQLLPVDRTGALSQDPPEMIAATVDVVAPSAVVPPACPVGTEANPSSSATAKLAP